MVGFLNNELLWFMGVIKQEFKLFVEILNFTNDCLKYLMLL